MRSGLIGIIAAVGCLFLAGCAVDEVLEPEEDWVGFTSPQDLAEADLQYYWDIQLPLNRGETVQRLKLMDERLYAMTSDNRMLAIDAARGIWDWSRNIARADDTVYRPVHADNVQLPDEPIGVMELRQRAEMPDADPADVVMVNSLHRLLVMDRADGRVIRDIELGFAANTGGGTDGSRFYVGDTRGWYHCIRLVPAVRAWTLTTGGMLSAPLVSHAGMVFVGGEDAMFRAAAAADDGELIWTRRAARPITAPFHVDDRGAFVPSEDHRLHAFSLQGDPLWETPFACEGPLRDAVQVGANTVFQYARQDKFYAIRLTDGSQRWTAPEGRRILAVMDGEVYLLDDEKNLQIRDEVTGQKRTTVDLRGFAVFADNVSDSAVFVATRDGRVSCIRNLDADYLTVEDLRRSGDR